MVVLTSVVPGTTPKSLLSQGIVLTFMTLNLNGWEVFSMLGALTHIIITWALSTTVQQVPIVTLGSPLCPWCFRNSSWRGIQYWKTCSKSTRFLKEWKLMPNLFQPTNNWRPSSLMRKCQIQLEAQQKENGETFLFHQERARRFWLGSRHWYHYWTSYNCNQITIPPHNHFTNRSAELEGSFPMKHSNSTCFWTHLKVTPRVNTLFFYQPCYKSKGLDRQQDDFWSFRRFDEHFERECNLNSMLDQIKDYEHHLFAQQKWNINGHVYNLEEPPKKSGRQHKSYNCELLYQIIDVCLIELNMLEFPLQTSLWYLDSGATHHLFGSPPIFTIIHPASGACSAGG